MWWVAKDCYFFQGQQLLRCFIVSPQNKSLVFNNLHIVLLALYSKPGNQIAVPFSVKPENNSMELVSPRINSENHTSGIQGAPLLQSNWHFPGSTEMSEVGARKPDGYDNLSQDPHQGGR